MLPKTKDLGRGDGGVGGGGGDGSNLEQLISRSNIFTNQGKLPGSWAVFYVYLFDGSLSDN